MLWFLVRFIVLYVLLMIPWPGVAATYRDGFVRAGSFVYGAMGARYAVRLEAKVRGPDYVDTNVRVRHQSQVGEVEMGINSREVGYLATVVLVCLVLATPAPWRRMLRSLALGLLLVHVFIAFRPFVLMLYWANVTPPAAPSLWDKAISAVVQFIGVGQPLSYIVPMMIWILVAVRRDVLARLVPGIVEAPR